jgi:hypothetical protein
MGRYPAGGRRRVDNAEQLAAGAGEVAALVGAQRRSRRVQDRRDEPVARREVS